MLRRKTVQRLAEDPAVRLEKTDIAGKRHTPLGRLEEVADTQGIQDREIVLANSRQVARRTGHIEIRNEAHGDGIAVSIPKRMNGLEGLHRAREQYIVTLQGVSQIEQYNFHDMEEVWARRRRNGENRTKPLTSRFAKCEGHHKNQVIRIA